MLRGWLLLELSSQSYIVELELHNLEFKILDCQNPEFKILNCQNPEFKILAYQNPEFNIQAFQNPEFKIWHSKILNSRFKTAKIQAFQNPEFKILAFQKLEFKTAKISNSGFWQSLALTLSHNSTEITLLLVNLKCQVISTVDQFVICYEQIFCVKAK